MAPHPSPAAPHSHEAHSHPAGVNVLRGEARAQVENCSLALLASVPMLGTLPTPPQRPRCVCACGYMHVRMCMRVHVYT